MDVNVVDEEMFEDGVMFDGSSIAGWKDISQSDMTLMPDPGTATMDPFAAQNSLIIFCDIIEPTTGESYSRDPRSAAKRAETYLNFTGLGDRTMFGPEAEFFVFDDVRFNVGMNACSYSIDQEEGPYNSQRQFEGGNIGHRPAAKGGYFPVPPVDSMSDLRAEMVTIMAEMGLDTEKHHHEVAPSQNELGIQGSSLVRTADMMQVYKYVVHNVAHSYGKTATFMPKPIMDDNGSGMHIHQSIWRGDDNTFAGTGYADLSENALYYIGGVMKHARAINAFSNPTTNSYKRLVPGFEAPVLLAYSARNRSASCRIPYASSPNGKRVEVRFPDPAANPYLTFAAMLMAGIDGIENKDPSGRSDGQEPLRSAAGGTARTFPPCAVHCAKRLIRSMGDRDFLKKGDVFTDDIIDGYIELKWDEVHAFEQTTHPIEFSMYYSV